MHPNPIIKWSKIILTALIAFSFAACDRYKKQEGQFNFVEQQQNLKAGDFIPLDNRKELIESASSKKFIQYSIEMKMVESRYAILYLTDILPEKGNPYYHMAEFGEKSLEGSFILAKENGPEMTEPGLWLPKNNGKDITAKMLADDKELREVVNYFAQYVATSKVLEEAVYPAFADSALILPLSESVSPEAAANFARVFGNPKTGQVGHIQFITKQYLALYEKNPVLKELLDKTIKKVTLNVASIIAKAMRPHVDWVAYKAFTGDLFQLLDKVETLKDLSVSNKDLASTKKTVATVFDPTSPGMKGAEKAFNGVDLPESSEIDAYAESFEVVMRLEIGFDVLQYISNVIAKW